VLEKRESKSRPTQGVVTVHTRAFNQDGVQIMDFVRSALVPKRGHAVGDKA
jgi:acyl dehydratase